MTRRRISLALIAAATTTLALVTPAQAATTEDNGLSSQLSAGSSVLGSSSPTETETPTETPTETAAPGTETTVPPLPEECEDAVDDEPAAENADADEAVDCEPEVALGSLEMTEEMEWVFLGFEVFFTLGTAVITALSTYAKVVPGGADQLRGFLDQFGINL